MFRRHRGKFRAGLPATDERYEIQRIPAASAPASNRQRFQKKKRPFAAMHHFTGNSEGLDAHTL